MKISDIPGLVSDHEILARAFRVALGDICSNLVPFCEGGLERPAVCLAAGLHYATPWTRDNSLSAMNAIGLFLPEVAENSLRAVLENDPARGGWRIGGQYWDAIIWAQAAWALYLYRGDRKFLADALPIIERSLAWFEESEFDPARGLFRGPAFFQDGISGYPDELSNGFGCDVRGWVVGNPEKKWPVGFGIPWFSLSSNCLYVGAYDTVGRIRAEIGAGPSDEASAKAGALREAIRREFWNPARGSFDYLVLPDGRRCEHQEAAGLAFAILLDVATPGQTAEIMRSVHIAPAGIPCVWPQFPRYAAYAGDHYGRHCGTVWPQVQALWARAALKAGRTDYFAGEIFRMAGHAARDGHFTEIYNPVTGEEYGGLQEHWSDSRIVEWKSEPHTCWGATGFLSLIHHGIFGMDYTPEGVRFRPFLPEGVGKIALSNIPYRNALVRVSASGAGCSLASFRVNGVGTEPFLPSDSTGDIRVEIVLGGTASVSDENARGS
jgi:glycogen debranching enzyme